MACLDGSGGFDFAGLAALKTHVSLREALEIEAIKCVAGDSRHEFQAFYPLYIADQRKQGADPAKLGQLDPAKLLEEIEMTRTAIDEHEALLADHRLAVVSREPSPLSDADVDETYAVIESLRTNLPVLEAEHARVLEQFANSGIAPRRGDLGPLRSVGPVQSGTLRPSKDGS